MNDQEVWNRYDKVPAELKEQPNWVVWGVDRQKPKMPYSPLALLNGYYFPAHAGDRRTWDSFQNAVLCVSKRKAKGIGYEFDGRKIYGVDLDHVIDEQGQISAPAQKIIDTLSSYTEISPSGTGVHIFVFAPNCTLSHHRKKEGFIEIYHQARYFTVTGNALEHADIADRSAELQQIHDEYLCPKIQPSVQSRRQFGLNTDGYLDIGLKKDRMLISSWNGNNRWGDESGSDLAFMNKLAYWCNANPDLMIRAFLSSPYYAQKDDFHKKKCQRKDYLPATAAVACSSLRSTAAEDMERRSERSTRYNRWSYAR